MTEKRIQRLGRFSLRFSLNVLSLASRHAAYRLTLSNQNMVEQFPCKWFYDGSDTLAAEPNAWMPTTLSTVQVRSETLATGLTRKWHIVDP